jgi:hypothetical protein
MLFYSFLQARSSVGERFLDTEEVRGSIPLAPTIEINNLPADYYQGHGQYRKLFENRDHAAVSGI